MTESEALQLAVKLNFRLTVRGPGSWHAVFLYGEPGQGSITAREEDKATVLLAIPRILAEMSKR